MASIFEKNVIMAFKLLKKLPKCNISLNGVVFDSFYLKLINLKISKYE